MVSYETRLITLTIHCNLQLNKPLLCDIRRKTSSFDESFPIGIATFEFPACSVAGGYHFGHECMYEGLYSRRVRMKLTHCWTCRDNFNSPNVDDVAETSLRWASDKKIGRSVAYRLAKNCYTIWRNRLELAT